MGDGKSYFDSKDRTLTKRECGKCLKKPRQLVTFPFPTTSSTTTTTVSTSTEFFDDDSTADPVELVLDDKEKRERRSYDRYVVENLSVDLYRCIAPVMYSACGTGFDSSPGTNIFIIYRYLFLIWVFLYVKHIIICIYKRKVLNFYSLFSHHNARLG